MDVPWFDDFNHQLKSTELFHVFDEYEKATAIITYGVFCVIANFHPEMNSQQRAFAGWYGQLYVSFNKK